VRLNSGNDVRHLIPGAKIAFHGHSSPDWFIASNKEYYNALMDDLSTGGTDDALVEILSASGFQIVPLQTIVDALASMEEYLREQTGITQDELEEYLRRIEELIGKQEAFKLELDEIVSWIRAFQSVSDSP